MKEMISKLIFDLLENYVYEITNAGMGKCFDKYKRRKFLKEIKKDVNKFCDRNACPYLDSSAFEHFIRSTRFVERIIERATATKLENSKKDFLKDEIKKAHNIADAESTDFSNNEERIIKDLFQIIDNKVGNYYMNTLSTEQRHIVAVCIENMERLQDSVDDFRNRSLDNEKKIIDMLSNEFKLSDAKTVIIADLLSAELREERFKEFDNLALAVIDKSEDLAIYHESLNSIMCDENCEDAVKKIAFIRNHQIRDNAIRTALPVLIFRKENIASLLSIASAEALKEIIACLVKQERKGILTDTVSVVDGLEKHEFAINKKLEFEEKWLTRQIVVQFLADIKIRNIFVAMENVEIENSTLLSKLLIADRKIEKYGDEGTSENNIGCLETIVEALKSKMDTYDNLCGDIRALYHSVIAKAYLMMNRITDAENSIPDDIKMKRPLSDYVLAIKIEKREVDIEEVYNYSIKNKTYWLINNFFVGRRNEDELISFCRKHEEMIQMDIPLLFMYVGALKVQGLQEERELTLNKYSDILQCYYEYWNEMLDISQSEETQKAFIESCRNGKMTGMLIGSYIHMIERLLVLREYDIAELYVGKYKNLDDNDYRIKKYEAIIQQGKKNDVQAIKWFKDAFADNPKDIYVIDSLIALCLTNRRKVEKSVIDAAIEADTSRLHMLVAAYYLSEGKVSEAKNENIKSILRSQESYNPAYGQFLAIETYFEEKNSSTINGIEGGTATFCRNQGGKQFWLCVYKDDVLPTSPYIWNNDYHVYIHDAAAMGCLRKHKGDHICVYEHDCEIIDVISIDAYLFRTCILKMTQNGFAKELMIPSKEGKMDITVFKELILQNTPEERNAFNWLEQYSNEHNFPMPLFVYKDFTNMTYLEFVDMILSTDEIIVREIPLKSILAEKYIISFSALVALYKAGVPSETIVNMGGAIMESTMVQIKSDVSEIIKKYDRETVASFGVIDGNIFLNQVGEEGKDYWIKEAGLIKKYCESIPTVANEEDLAGPFFEGFDSKEILGICDYDAISFIMGHSEYSFVTIEAMLYSMSVNEKVQLKVTSIPDWLINQGISADDLLSYIKMLMDQGCLMSVTKNVIEFLSKTVKDSDDRTKNELYSKWDGLLSSVDDYPEKHRMVAVQTFSEVLASFKEDLNQIDRSLLHIMVDNILYLRKQKIEVFMDETGYVSLSLVDISSEQQLTREKDSE